MGHICWLPDSIYHVVLYLQQPGMPHGIGFEAVEECLGFWW
jgi:hypothetical protein